MRPSAPSSKRFVLLRLWLVLALAAPLGLFTPAQHPLAAPPPVEAGTGVWTTDGPYGGNIQAIDYSPGFATDRTVFVATTQGVWKSTTGGDNWIQAGVGLTKTTALAVTPDYAQGQTLFAGTAGAGVYKSQDGGQHWTAVNTGLGNLDVKSLVVPDSYAVTPTVMAGTGAGLYRSDDGGASWTVESWMTSTVAVNVLAASPDYQNDNVVWAGTSGGQVQSGQTLMIPLARSYHTAIYDASHDRMLVFGGNGGDYLNDVWMLDLTALIWTPLNPSGTPPPARTDSAAIYDAAHDRMVVFGGYRDPNALNDTWALDLTTLTWTQLNPTGTLPAARFGHTAIYDAGHDRMLVFGGRDEINNYFNDVQALDLTTLTWTILSLSGSPPTARTDHAAIYDADHDRMIVFGGYNGDELNDTWALDLTALNWTPLNPSGSLPSHRSEHTATYDATHDRLIVFGGYDNGVYLNDAWALDLAALAWIQLSPGETRPEPRIEHTAIYDTAHERMIVFGGSKEFPADNANDTWALDLATLGSEAWYVATNVESIALSPTYPQDQTLFIGKGGDLLKSVDSGATWSRLRNGLPTSAEYRALALSPGYDTDGLVFAGTSIGLYYSDDGGATWQARNNGLNALDIQCLALSSAYGSDETLFVGTGSGLSRSPNGGLGWTAANVGLRAVNTQQVVASPGYTTDQSLFAAGETGLFKSTNAGQAWTAVNNGITKPQAHDVALSPGYLSDQTLFAATDNGVFRSGDGGGVWASFSNGLGEGTVSGLVLSPDFLSDQTLFAVMTDQGVQRSTDGGGHWDSSRLANEQINDLSVSPAFGADQRAWAGTDQGLFTSVDGGATWDGWPFAHHGHTSIYDDLHDRMIIFGGSADAPAGNVNDSWALDLTTLAWTQLSPSGILPSVRSGHTAIYDASRERMIVFGGYNIGETFNDIWALDLTTLVWTQLNPSGTLPAARSGHSAIYDALHDRMIIFGGDKYNNGYLNDTWALDLTTLAWTQLNPSGTLPAARSGHSAIYDTTREQMLIFGGSSDGGSLNDSWALDLTTLAWTQLNPSSKPTARSWHTAIYDALHDRMVIFGGVGSYPAIYNDTWALDLTTVTWSHPNPGGTLPAARYGHTAIYDTTRDRMVIFGGTNRNSIGYDDLWALDLTTPTWAQFGPGDTAPTARSGHTAIYDAAHNQMVVFGGSNYDVNAWALDLETWVWSRLNTSGTPPVARYGHTAIYDAAHNQMVVFGGFKTSGGYLGDTWVLDLTTLVWSQTGGGPSPRKDHTAIYDAAHERMIVFGGSNIAQGYLNDTWAFNLTTRNWTQLSPTGTPPPVRFEHSAIYDAARERMIVFGGCCTYPALYNDIWALDLTTLVWTQLNPSGTLPAARSGHSAIYDVLHDRMIIFGGYNYNNGYLNDTWALDLTTLAWSQLNPSGALPAARLDHTAIYDPVGRLILYGGDNGNVWTLDLGGLVWTQISMPRNFTGEVIRLLAVSPGFSVDQTLFLVSGDYVYRSTDGGATWIILSTLLGVSDLLFSPAYASDHTLYAVANGDVYQSLDSGATWTQFSAGFTANSLAIAPDGNTWTLFAAATDGVWNYTFPRSESIRTLIITNQARLAERYGQDAADALLQKLYDLADHQDVQGLVVDVGNTTEFPELAADYAAWDATLITTPTVPAGPNLIYLPLISRSGNLPGLNTQLANQVALDIRQVVLDHTAAFSNTQYLVLVGGDDIIPFHRLPDGTSNTSLPYTNYAHLQGSIASALADRMTLSDDPYSGLTPLILADGSTFYMPELSAGRLVELPDDITAAIDAFLTSNQINEHALAFASGADDYLIDGAYAISDTLNAANLAVSSLIGNNWTADDLAARFLQSDNDIVSLNQHAYHNQLLAPDNTFLSPQDVISATGDLERTLIYAMGCHAGLSVPDGPNGALGLDFPQAFARKGAAYVGNTGYGWATLYAVGLTERLLLYYSQALAPAPASTTTIGQALRDAKQRYYLNAWTLDNYDQKVLNELTLYGLPMYRLSTPVSADTQPARWSPTQVDITYMASGSKALASIPTNTASLSINQPVRVTSLTSLDTGVPPNVTQASLQFLFPAENFTFTDVGDALYYSYAGEVQANRGLPLLPRFSFGIAIPGAQTQGAVFVSGIYSDVLAAPVTTTAIISDTGGLDPSSAYVPGQWYPTVLELVTQLTGGSNDRLSTSLGQMRKEIGPGGGDIITPTQRLYNNVAYEVYYYNQFAGGAPDRTPPQVTSVQTTPSGATTQVSVGVVDVVGVGETTALGLWRVLVTYTSNTPGTGTWDSVELAYNSVSQRWVGVVPSLGAEGLLLVQAIDRGGNVAADDNRGWYYTAP